MTDSTWDTALSLAQVLATSDGTLHLYRLDHETQTRYNVLRYHAVVTDLDGGGTYMATDVIACQAVGLRFGHDSEHPIWRAIY
jgi:hypothetical protein